MTRFRSIVGTKSALFVFLAAFIALSIVSSILPARADVPPATSCAVTPSLLGGQGFRFSGQGFRLSGQGFRLSGQGFRFSGQGFSLQEVGLDPNAVAQQILDNPVTPGKWVDDRLNFFLNRLGFNTEATAILVIDEFNAPDAHGFEVQQVVTDSITALKLRVPTLKVDVFPIDVSESGTNYNADIIASKISAKVNALKPTYHHFVLNMSFGLIACQDAGTSSTPAFDFTQAQNVVKANNQATPTLGITPVLECVIKKSGGYGGYGTDSQTFGSSNGGGHKDEFTAYFGYRNENGQLISIPISHKNKFTTSPQDRQQPTEFEPGQQHFVFAVTTKESSLTWSVTGPDGQTRTVTATKNSTPCAQTIPSPSQNIVPLLDCVADEGNGMFSAHFGYRNPNILGSKIPVGQKNKFAPPGNPHRGQVTTFAPGEHHNVFEVYFNGSNLTWIVTGNSVTANSSSPGCAEEEGFGVSQYLTQNLGVAPDKLDEYWQNLANKAANDNSLTGLRNLLKGYLQASADPYQNFTVVAIASSGNMGPWMGAAPLAPASWPETIAVGATLDDGTALWSPFSQNANVVAPGAGYPFGDNNFGAGTSFSAPAFSVLVGMCSTVPHGLRFDGTFPPLTAPVVNGQGQKVLNNSVIGLDNLSPLNCKPNRAPVIADIADRTDPAGSSILFQVSANDPDGDQLTFSATGLPPGLGIDSQGRISGIISNSASGPYNVTITVKDNGTPQGMDTEDFIWTVSAGGPLHVNIDIKPFSTLNRINLRSWGIVPVAILGSATFDASTVDPRSVTLAGAPVIIFRWLPVAILIDINHDGYRDLVVSVKVKDLQLTPTSTEAVLNGKTFGGQAIQGSDHVTIVPPHAPHNLTPYTGTTVNTRTVTLNWEPIDEEDQANTCYQVAIGRNASFTNMAQSATVITLPTYTAFQMADGTYYWRVAISDCAGNTISPWSETWGFSVRGS